MKYEQNALIFGKLQFEFRQNSVFRMHAFDYSFPRFIDNGTQFRYSDTFTPFSQHTHTYIGNTNERLNQNGYDRFCYIIHN